MEHVSQLYRVVVVEFFLQSVLTYKHFSSESPVESPQKATRHAKQRSRNKKKQHPSNTVWEPSMVPPCLYCGAARVFELQLVPSLLHILEVDKFALDSSYCTSGSNGSKQKQGLGAAFEEGGMNWGNIAIFSCPQACASEQEYVLIQKSIDGQPSQPREGFQQGDVFIQENSKFDDDDDDDNDENEFDDDDDVEDEMESEGEER